LSKTSQNRTFFIQIGLKAHSEYTLVFTRHQINVIDMVNKSRANIAYNIIDVEGYVTEPVISDIQILEHVAALRVLR
jgi:D-3-phosphoglycerate dehydrogenase